MLLPLAYRLDSSFLRSYLTSRLPGLADIEFGVKRSEECTYSEMHMHTYNVF